MINESSITAEIASILTANLDSKYIVERGEYVNTDPDRTPWVGVYPGATKYEPRTIGNGPNSWRAEFTIKLVIQTATLKANASDAEDDMGAATKAILDIVMADKTINNKVAAVKGINVVRTYNVTESNELYYQNAEIDIITEVRTS